MGILQNIASFIVVIGLLVAIHEFGHFWVARKTGVKVLRFSIGFGHVIWRYQKDEHSTEYALSAIPLGGYVKMVDEREGDVSAEDLPYAFTQKPLWARAAIVAAGPVFNLILAICIYWGIFMTGESGTRPLVGEVATQSLVGQAGFNRGEEILSVNGLITPTWKEAINTLLSTIISANETVNVQVKTEAGEQLTHTLIIPKGLAQDHQRLFKELGLKAWQPLIPPVIGKVVKDSVADQAGLKTGDLILRANETDFNDWITWVNYIQTHAGQSLNIVIQRDNRPVDIVLSPESVVNQGKIIGKVGIGVQIPDGLFQRLKVNYTLPPLAALNAAIQRTYYYSITTLEMMGAIFIGKASVDNLSGPVSIAQYAGQSAEQGALAFFKFLAIVSISLGVLNLLPIPVLDGGHLLMFAIEAIKGSPVSDTIQIIFQKIGMTALLSLMVLALFLDIGRLFS